MVDFKIASISSSETKAKISKIMTGRKFTEEHKANLSLAKKNSKGITVLNLATKKETNYTSINYYFLSKNRLPFEWRAKLKNYLVFRVSRYFLYI